MDVSRRNFMGASAAVAVAAGVTTQGKAYGANDKIGVCVIGNHGRGKSHRNAFSGSKDSEVVAVCDADKKVLLSAQMEIEKKTGKKPKMYIDMREAFADPEIDAVSIAAPNHWHTLASIWAAQAGKHVYVEKPLSHNVWEGRQMIAASKKYDVIIQHGAQRRSDPRWLRDIALLQSGEIIGDLHTVRGTGYKTGKNRDSLGFAKDTEAPGYLDWRLWQGPSTERPYNPLYVHYSWHWFWHYGNGEIMNQGIHQLDIAAWAMNKGLPVQIFSAGGRYTYDDQGETPNTNAATYIYEDGTMLTFDVRNRFTNREGGNMVNGKFHAGVGVGNLFYGNEGYYVEGQGFYDKKNKLIEVGEKEHPRPESEGAFQNFLNAVRSGNKEDNYANMEDAHISCATGHLGNISYQLGRSLNFDPKTERFVNDPEADALLRHAYEPGFEVPELAKPISS